METITANSPSELTQILRSVDISVPARTEGRTSEHCERWCICRLLATLNLHDRLSFPLMLVDRERPDFELHLGDRQTIGIEVTEVIPTDYAKASAMTEREEGDASLDLSLFKWDDRKTKEEFQEIVEAKKLSLQGWDDDQAEEEFANAVPSVIKTKTQKLRASGFSRFNTDVLLIYDNLPLPHLDLDNALSHLSRSLASYWTKSDRFSPIYIELLDNILCLSPSQQELLMLADLWNMDDG